MNISAPFIRRPVATSLLTAGLLLAGALAYRMLPVASLPEVAYPVIQVNAELPGASPDTMASAVATPLERMFGRIAGINQMTSMSQLGTTKSSCSLIWIATSTPQPATCKPPSTPPAGNCRPICRPIRAGARSIPPRRRSWFWRSPRTPPRKQQMFDVADSILAQKISADRRRRAGAGRRQFAAGRPRGSQPAAAEQAGHQPRSGARGAQRRQCQFAQGLACRIATAAFS